jgi:hypothetical protein
MTLSAKRDRPGEELSDHDCRRGRQVSCLFQVESPPLAGGRRDAAPDDGDGGHDVGALGIAPRQ